jgi:deoxycytidylate deaminase
MENSMVAILKPAQAEKSHPSKRGALFERFQTRKSGELIIALAGPIGCGIGSVIEGLKERLQERGYTHVVHIKLSAFLEEALAQNLVEEPMLQTGASIRFSRYRKLQEAGKSLGSRTGNAAILAEYAAREIALDRTRRDREQPHDSADGPTVPGRVAYMIDQVKRPEEVALLRAVYRNLFYLAGVTRISDRRIDSLTTEQVRSDEVQSLIEIDRLEDGSDGEQLDKTLHLADYFIRNNAITIEEKRRKLNRFLDLIHGDNSVTPTDPEHGMYSAYCASLRSACLSRQVGAVIATISGEVIATGCNDVPKASGGLYSASSKVTDMRCVHQDGQQCFNDLYKRKLKGEIGSAIDSVLSAENGSVASLLGPAERERLLDAIYKNTRLKDLIEFSRSVHTRMDAIVSLARIGGVDLRARRSTQRRFHVTTAHDTLLLPES